MASSERFVAGGRSSFSQKCSLLSQYLKENGSFGDLTLGLMTPKSAKPRGTMDLLPMLEKSGQSALPELVASEEVLDGSRLSGVKSEPENGQMTIFYAGQVMVFNGLPADKAEEIMKLAAAANHHSAALSPPRAAESATSAPIIAPAFPQPPLGSDLPIARKNSLARFLEKRKDRITANAPYPISKPVKTEEWLGLAPQRLSQIQRH